MSAICLLSAAVAAQPAPAPKAAAAPAAPRIEITDPMLAPMPPPHLLANWRDALQHLNARSIDLLVAQQELLRAEGQRRVALAGALPSVTGTVNVTGTIIQPSQNPAAAAFAPPNPAVSASLTASQPLLALRSWYAIGTADLGIKSAKLSADDKRRTALGAVANAVVAAFVAERTAELNRTALKSALETLELTRRKLKLGEATRIDVLRTEQDAAQTRANLVAGDETLRQARETLGFALGSPEAYGVPQSISLNEIGQSLESTCSAGSLDERADIRKQKNDVEVARRGINDVWLQFAPTITLSTTATVGNNSNSQPSWTVTGLLTVPFWEGGARYGNLKIARATHEEARIQLEAILRQATLDNSQAIRNLVVAEQARQVSAMGRDLAVELAKLTQRSYEVGTGTSFDLVQSQQQARAAEADLVVKEFGVIKAKLTAVLTTANCAY